MYQTSLEAADAEAAPSGSDEDGAQPVTADSLTFEGRFCNPEDDSPVEAKKKPKRKRGGQAGRGRARAKPMHFEPSLFQDEHLLKEFKKRVKFTNQDFLTFFTDPSVCPYLS